MSALVKRPSILYFGSDEFSVGCLKSFLSECMAANLDGSFGKLHVACPPKHGQSSKESLIDESPLQDFAEKEMLPVHLLPAKSLATWRIPQPFDIGAVASCRYFIPRKIIESFRMCTLNCHPSLLPKFFSFN
jgi:methionyl-tRNA formyltransferase